MFLPARSILAHLAVGAAVLSSACGDPGTPTGSGATTATSAGSPAGLTPDQASRVVAKVGDRNITLGDYAATLERMDQFDRLRYQTKEARRELLQEMIDIELLAQEARRRGLHERPEAQEASRQLLRDALLSEVRSVLPPPAEIPQDEVKAYFAAHEEEFREPERRRVSAIVLEKEPDATKLLETLRGIRKDDGTVEATAWGKLFAEHSATGKKDGRSAPADLAGDLGMVGPPDDAKGGNPRVPDAVRKAVFSLEKVGAFVDRPVESEGRLYLVRLSGLTKPHARTLAEADRTIRVALLKERMAKLEKELEADLRKKHEVVLDDAALAKLALPEAAKAAAKVDPADPPPASAASGSSGSAGDPPEAPPGAAPAPPD